ncbi:1,4-alpha-glucan branching protein GlgB [Desulfobacterota bacterium AH_259_B03_O07]|nr:1,4-alpha-glucan branching protein GlgB [Desulfobacterota bacterium AH_259_B03_O07]
MGVNNNKVEKPLSRNSSLTEKDIYLIKKGSHFRLYDLLGSHPKIIDGDIGTYFSVWAPNAEMVSVIGDFNAWNPESNPISLRRDESGIWEGFIAGIEPGAVYKYYIVSKYENYKIAKADPFSFYLETPPKTGSIVWDLNYEWRDDKWMKNRQTSNSLNAPWSVYEVHLGSWMRNPQEVDKFLTYRELAPLLVEYINKLGFTHVEFLPSMEHPFYGSWGYQILGYFAPTSRYGTPQDFMYLVDYLHQNRIGVILDWVPSHFPGDEYGLVYFDGTHLFEHPDPRRGHHPEWNSNVFNYGKKEVREYLISNALFWLDKYHVDGIRVDAVASMLYLDYGRKDGEWIPNEYGGNENMEAIEFLKMLNEAIYARYQDVQTIAEESTDWPLVSKPTHVGGLGFGMKWNMGWMHDTLSYFTKEPYYRKYHQNQLTFGISYAFSENFVLSLSHDEVVYGKGSLLRKMQGDNWQGFANLRALYGYMFGHPGKKLLFMGDEFGQWNEWYHEVELDWNLLDNPMHQGVQKWISDLNYFYRNEPAVFELDFSAEGFEWIDFRDSEQSIVSFIRKGRSTNCIIVVVCNFTPVPRYNYLVGVPRGGFWGEVLNSDALIYGGSGHGNLGGVRATPIPIHGRLHSISLTLPPLGVLFFKSEGNPPA